jgi:glycosyltransferase involved in cell wall biosynthesis
MRIHVIFHDPRLSLIAGGGEVLTLRKVRALDSSRFRISVVTRSEVRSPLFQKLLSERPDVQFIPVEVPLFNEEELRCQMQAKGVSLNVLKEPIIGDAIWFNLAAKSIYQTLKCDLLSVSVLPDLFCLEAPFKTVFHIYGCPPSDQAAEQQLLLERVTAVSAVSRHSSAEFQGLFPSFSRTMGIEILTPGLDDGFFQPLSESKKDIDFLYAGRLRPRKGVDLILKAMSILAQDGTKMPEIALVGDGPERSNLEKMAQTLEIDKSIHFEGMANTQEVIRWMDRSRWFLYPVRRPEAFGLAPLEAMARGVPPILGVLGGMSEYLNDGWNGYALPEVNEHVLAAFMRKALDEENKRTELQNHAVETANRFSWENFVERVNAFFEKAVK